MTDVTPAVLTDGIVRLRPPIPGDAEACFTACQDPDIQAWTTVPVPYLREHAEQWIAGLPASAPWDRELSWAITEAHDDTFLGNIGLRIGAPDGPAAGTGNIGYLLAPHARGRGLMARAVRLVCSWGFATLGLQVITWEAVVGNEASRRTAISAGFRVSDTVARKALLHRGERRDAWVGDLLPEDITPSGPPPRGPRVRGAAGGPGLTARERDVLGQLALGRSNRDAARALGISENTVKNHVRAVLEKLNAQSRAQAVVIAVRSGLVTITR